MTQATLQLKRDTKDIFEKARFKLKMREGRLITQDKFMRMILEVYKTKK